jgi:hypothetical protein
VQHLEQCSTFESLYIQSISIPMDFFIEEDNIWTAASDGDLKQVKKLIASGVNVNGQDDSGYSPM